MTNIQLQNLENIVSNIPYIHQSHAKNTAHDLLIFYKQTIFEWNENSLRQFAVHVSSPSVTLKQDQSC